MSKKLKTKPEEHQIIPLDDPKNYFYTYDLGCSAALVVSGFELISLEKTNPRKVQFIFRKEMNIGEVVSDYWADRLETKTRSFFDAIKMLKNRLYSE